MVVLPSGKQTQLWKITMLFMGKSTISTGPISMAMLVYQRVIDVTFLRLHY